MLTIEKSREGQTLTLKLTGLLDIKNSPVLQKELEDMPWDFDSLIFDLKNLEFLTSAGLRVLLVAVQEAEETEKELKLINVPDEIMSIFKLTGFSDVLTIE